MKRKFMIEESRASDTHRVIMASGLRRYAGRPRGAVWLRAMVPLEVPLAWVEYDILARADRAVTKFIIDRKRMAAVAEQETWASLSAVSEFLAA